MKTPAPLLALAFTSALFAAYIFWQGNRTRQRLRDLKIAESYVATFGRALWASRAGWLIFFGTFGAALYLRTH